jgi:hypothetical protein
MQRRVHCPHDRNGFRLVCAAMRLFDLACRQRHSRPEAFTSLRDARYFAPSWGNCQPDCACRARHVPQAEPTCAGGWRSKNLSPETARRASCYATRRLLNLPDGSKRKYFRMKRPSRLGSGAPQVKHVSSLSVVTDSASTRRMSYRALQFGQLNRVGSDVGMVPLPPELTLRASATGRLRSFTLARSSEPKVMRILSKPCLRPR